MTQPTKCFALRPRHEFKPEEAVTFEACCRTGARAVERVGLIAVLDGAVGASQVELKFVEFCICICCCSPGREGEAGWDLEHVAAARGHVIG